MTLLAFHESRSQEPISPITLPVDINLAKVELGKKLFFDPRLSKSGWISCNFCHNLMLSGTDNLVTSIGHQWAQGPINAPTVFNAVYSIAQFWDGRARDLTEQAAGPIANPNEMASTHELAVDVLQTIPGYQLAFSRVYGQQQISIAQVTDAIAEFERTLVTPNSRFDQWLLGDKSALSQEEQEGYALFKLYGCAGCHNGPAAGGRAFQVMGMFNSYDTQNPANGRETITGQRTDRMRFKVPSLRNVELTYPYFHDGQAKTLEEAVDTMAWVQVNRKFSRTGNAKVVAFLKSLTGELPRIILPVLSPSGPDTPQPQPFE